MRAIVTIIGVVVCLGIAVVYGSGVIAPSTEREETCPICRAVKYSGRQYGISYSRVEENGFTRWYRANVDPDHGLDPDHPHTWYSSRCDAAVAPNQDILDSQCPDVPVLFLVRPEVELEALQHIPDRAMRSAFIASLNSPSRQENVKRIRLLVQYTYMQKDRVPWSYWWRRHAATFGLPVSAGISR